MNIRLSLAAEMDVQEIYSWYLNQREDLGPEFKRSLDTCLGQIQQNPLAYPKVYGKIRRALLHRFPYCVFYIVREVEIMVIGVFHGHRNPKVWKRRQDA